MNHDPRELSNRLENGRNYLVRTFLSGTEDLPPFTSQKLFVQKARGQTVIVTTAEKAWPEMLPQDESYILNDSLHLASEGHCLEIDISSI
jgi:hypothetical protein